MWLAGGTLRTKRYSRSVQDDDPLVEVAPEQPDDWHPAPDRPRGFRLFVGGFLYVEGTVLLICGLVLMTSYWPPYAIGESPGSIISKVGLVISGAAVSYLILVGLAMFIYNLRNPPLPTAPPESPVLQKAAWYRGLRSRPYLLDNSLTCAEEADIAMLARKTLR